MLVAGISVNAQVAKVTFKLLTPEPKAKAGQTITLRIQAKLPAGFHINSLNPKLADVGPMPTEITVGEGAIMKLAGTVRGDRAPKKKYDSNFEGETEFWEGSVTFSVPVKVAADLKPGRQEGWVNINYQICDHHMCFPPRDEKLSLALEIVDDTVVTASPDALAQARQDSLDKLAQAKDTTTTAPTDTVAAATPDTAAPPVATKGNGGESISPGKSNDETIGGGQDIENAAAQGLGSFLWLAASAGALALLTPCVFPMIPITISFFTKRTQSTKKKSLRDAGLYSLGIILTFTLLGFLLALLLGAAGINNFASDPTVNIIIGIIFFALALSLFGMYEIQLPTSVLNRLNRKAEGQGDSFVGVMLMGLVFSLTSFTCTVPFVGGLMVMATSSGNWLWPLMGMAVFAAVFSAPFFLLALFPALLKSLPKSGGWLNSVKVVMGFVETAMAIKFLSNADLVMQWGFLTREFFLASWIAIAVLITIYLLGKFHLPHDSFLERVGPVRVVFAMGFLAAGFWLLTGLFGGRLGDLDAYLPPQEYPGKGNTSLLANIPGGGHGGQQESSGQEKWHEDDYKTALAAAKESGKPIFIDFTGYTCTNCRWMEKNMFPRNDVADMMQKYVLLRLYTDGRKPVHKENLKLQERRFKTISLPFYAIVSPNDSVITTSGYTPDSEKFLQFLQKGLNGNGAMAAR
jgi:thiol:disulfide interchange protein DsbD